MKRARVGTDRDWEEIGNRQQNEGTAIPGNADHREDGPMLTLDQYNAKMEGGGPTPDSELASSHARQQGPTWCKNPLPLVPDFPKSYI